MKTCSWQVLIAGVLILGCSTNSKVSAPSSVPKPEIAKMGQEGLEKTQPQQTSAAAVAKKNDEEEVKVQPTSNDYKALSQARNKKDDDEFLKAIYAVLAKNPNDLKATNALAMYYLDKRKLGAAKLLLKKGLEKNPDNASLHNNLGLVFLAENDNHRAFSSFRKSIELDPKNPAASAHLGAIYVQNHDYQRALPAMELAYQEFRNNSSVANNYAVAAAGAGNLKLAQRLFKDALDKERSNKTLLLNYSILLVDSLKDYKEAMNIINRYKFVSSDSENTGRILELEKKAKEGLK